MRVRGSNARRLLVASTRKSEFSFRPTTTRKASRLPSTNRDADQPGWERTSTGPVDTARCCDRTCIEMHGEPETPGRIGRSSIWFAAGESIAPSTIASTRDVRDLAMEAGLAPSNIGRTTKTCSACSTVVSDWVKRRLAARPTIHAVGRRRSARPTCALSVIIVP